MYIYIYACIKYNQIRTNVYHVCSHKSPYSIAHPANYVILTKSVKTRIVVRCYVSLQPTASIWLELHFNLSYPSRCTCYISVEAFLGHTDQPQCSVDRRGGFSPDLVSRWLEVNTLTYFMRFYLSTYLCLYLMVISINYDFKSHIP